MLSAGHPIKGLVKEFPESEKAILESQNVKSILAIPIMIKGKFWDSSGLTIATPSAYGLAPM